MSNMWRVARVTLVLAACSAPVPPPPVVAPPAPRDAGAVPDPQEPAEPAYWRGRNDLIRAPAPPHPAELNLPRYERWEQRNGLQVLVVPRHELPLVSFSLAVKAGAHEEQKGKTLGVADFTAAMLRKGTRRHTADQISNLIDAAGGVLEAASGPESTVVTCTVLTRDAGLCLDLLAEMVLEPTFPEAEMAEIGERMIAGLDARYDNPAILAVEHFENQLFGDRHPDGWVLEPSDVRRIDRDALVSFWRAYYRPNNAILAVAGDVDARKLRTDIDRALAPWAKGDVQPRQELQVPELKGARMLLVDKPDLSQATLVFGHRGIRHLDPDWYAVTVMNYVLGGSDFSSRLMTEVRARRGLTYSIGSTFGASLFEGSFRVVAATRNASVWDALLASVNELRRMKALGPSADELAKAKGFFAGSYPLHLQSSSDIAESIVEAELHGLGVTYVKQLAIRLGTIDVEQARAAAKSWLHPDTLVVVIVGRAAEIEPVLLPQLKAAGIGIEKINYKEPISRAVRQSLKK